MYLTYRDRVSKEKIYFAKKLRKNATFTERLLWNSLRKKQLGVKFHRQKVMFGYIVDFWCPKRLFIIEIDGKGHLKEKDDFRDSVFKSHGIRTLRFTNEQVLRYTNKVLNIIKYLIK